MEDNHVEHNGSGYIDETVDAVIKNEHASRNREIENYKYHKMVKHIKEVLDNNNYVLDGPISLINMESGRKRRIY